MSRRPANLNLGDSKTEFTKPLPSPRTAMYLDLPSPRVGEIPPALSPLDAFALQSRMLAKKFEESQQQGRRISRLPHNEIANELARRPGYFRQISGASSRQESGDEDEQTPLTMPVEPVAQQVIPKESRPQSHYPRFDNAAADKKYKSGPNTSGTDIWYDAEDGGAITEEPSYFGILPRASSPEPVDPQLTKTQHATSALPSLTGSIDSVQSTQPRTNTDDSILSNRNDYGLAPPKSSHHPHSARSVVSIRSVIDSADEDGASTNDPYDLLPPRKFSNSSGFSRPHSPITPDPYPSCRSPSAMSELSANSSQYPRPSFNFSRPLSSSSNKPFMDGRPSLSSRPSYDSRPSFEYPTRQSSMDQANTPLRQASTTSVESEGHTPKVNDTEATSDEAIFSDEEPSALNDQNGGAASYIYSKYSLPRGRIIERGSLGKRDSWTQHQFTWEEPRESSPAPRSVSSPSNSPNLSTPQRPETARMYSEGAFGSNMGSPRTPDPYRTHPSSPSLSSQATDRTKRAHVRNSPSADIVNMSPEQHLEKGIECHSSGSLSKSTYHLRLAARAGLPTAMLLYALACRHGWGMRPNQAEGVMWLKRAVDFSSLELLGDDDALSSSSKRHTQFVREDKTRKAQFALAIYELGMSYQHGWGISKDKALALRCFEIAGSWGDCDALAEAGFCYAQGLGCKKDMKKSAAFYRRAAEGGISVAGNSWYVLRQSVAMIKSSNNYQDIQAKVHGHSISSNAIW